VRPAEVGLHQKIADLEQFANMAAHDLQEPLRTMAGYTELAVQRYGSTMDPRARELLELAAEGARRMQDLVESALLAAENGVDRRRLTSSAEAASLAIANLRQAVEKKQARIRLGILPQVLADPVQLTRLLQNLISNGIRHGGASPEITVDCEDRARDWVFRVADNGKGFAGRPVPGLGLQICARIAERHGGRLWTASADRGAVLCFSLAKG
jgi:light-regulated signal transduction histidine kinase (bacteriophytochrome)